MSRSRSDARMIRFEVVLGIMLFKGIEDDDVIRDTRGPRDQGCGIDT